MDNSERYDKLHFIARPSPERHPDKLAAIGFLCGLKPINPGFSRILEIGCGTGANIIAIAESCPKSKCVGIDISVSQIVQGRDVIERLGISNVELRVGDIATVDITGEEYDYIICHGVYSWVPENIRQCILKLIGNHLAPTGLAMLSFLGRQGWHIRGIIYDYLMSRVDLKLSPSEQVSQARGLLSSIKELQIDDMSHYGILLRAEIELIEAQSDALIFHELLNPSVHPYLMKELKADLSVNSLEFCADLRRYHKLFADQCQVVAGLHTSGCLDVHDIVSPMRMHSALLCRANYPDRKSNILNAIECLCISSPHVLLVDDNCENKKNANNVTSSDVFISPTGQEFQCTSDLAAIILSELSSNWPAPMPVSEIVKKLCGFSFLKTRRSKDEVIGEIAHLLCDNIVVPHATTLGIEATFSKRPSLGRLALYELEQQDWATNKRHEFTVFNSIEKRIALLMNASNTLDDISKIVVSWLKDGSLSAQDFVEQDFLLQDTSELNSEQLHKSIAEGLVSEVCEKLINCAFF